MTHYAPRITSPARAARPRTRRIHPLVATLVLATVAVAGDGGTTLKVKVSFTDDDGEAEMVTSAATATVAAANNPATGVPTITGTAQVGETLTAVTTGIMDADGLTSPSYTYQWIRVETDSTETDISGATSSTYTLVAADEGTTLKVKVSFTDDNSNAETRTSVATGTVAEAQGDPEEACPGGGYNPTPVAVAVTAVPIVVASTTADYFVLYVRHTVGETTTVEVPVLVTLGKAGTTTLAENVEALPAERYRVEKYLIADPADVDGDCVDDITELGDPVGMNPVNPAPAIALSDGAVAIPDQETFETLAFYQETVKFFLIGMDTDRPGAYFSTTDTHRGHQSFLDAVGIDRDQLGLVFGWIIYDSKLVAPDGSQGVYYYQLLPRNTDFGFSLLWRSYTLLAASMPLLDDNLALHISNDELRSLRSSLSLYRESRIALVFDDDVLRGTDFLALNPGEGFGLLRALDPDERPTPRDVVIYETLPNNLPRVAGIISTVPQTPLSHVNLRAVQDGIPNAFIRNALEDTDIEPLIGSYVHYTVTQQLRPLLPGSPPGPPDGWALRAATLAQVNAHYAASRPSRVQTPEFDLSVTGIKPLSEIGFEDWKAFGVKAANVAVLGTLGFPAGTVPAGFAIPFYFYDEFMKHNDFYTRIDTMLADPDFQSKFDTQDDMLDDLRDDIKDAETPPWIIAAIVEMNEGFSEGINRRYRSSTNNEDLPGFNGAGLYDSKSQKPSEDEDDLAKSLKEVYASLWNFRAFTEREFHRIDHKAAAMGVLVHPSYQDELANGVAVSFDPIYGSDEYYYVNTQLGEDLVTNPDAQSVPEEIQLHQNGNFYSVLATSNQVPPGQLLMSNAQLNQLGDHLTVIHEQFAVLYNPAPDEQFAMEIEFKITSDNILAIKQARPWVFDNARDAPSPPPPPPPPPADNSPMVAAPNTPATGAPTITGTAQVGETLTAATTGIMDADGLASVSYAYQWIRVETDSTETDISGATSSTYTLVAADAGTTIKVKVSFTDDASNAEMRTSATTAAVAAAANNPATGVPTITGTAQVGETLTAVTTGIMDADGLTSPTYAYQWIRVISSVDADIAGATSSTYTLVAANEGATIKVRVTFTDDASNPETRTSAATAPVAAAANNPATGAPTITGTAQVGETLTAVTTGIMDADGLASPTYAYQWIRVETDSTETDISGATSSTYTLVAADAGTTIKVKVSFTDDASNPETRTSAPTVVVVLKLSVVLKLMPDSIGENGGVSTVTASLNRASSTVTTVTVSAMAVDPAVSNDFMLSPNRILTIPVGQTDSTGTVTVRAVNNTVDAPNKTVTVSATADNSQGVAGSPSPVTLRITDDDDAPEVTLKLTPDSIGENGGVSTVTASLNRASSAVTTVTVTAEAVSAAVSGDFTLSTNRTLTIPAGDTSSTGRVTVRAVNNTVDVPNKEVRVSATADNTQGVEGNPSPVTLRITDDDDAPVLTLAVRPSAIEEADDRATVTVEIVNGTTFAEDQPIALTFAGTATKGSDYTVELERLTLTAGESSVATTVTAVDDALDDEAETIQVTARHGGGVIGAEQTITIIDDDAAPMITMASLILVAENETAVATLTATDADPPAEDLVWRITGGADRNRFRLTPDGALAFRAAPDYEAPGDSDRNGDYEVTVEVSDGANPVEAVLTVRLEDVDDTAPVFSSASVNGATLTLAYGEALDGSSTPEVGDFTVSGGDAARTVSNVGVSGRAVTLTLDPAVEHGETGIRVSYRPGTDPIQDAAGNDAAGLSNVRVTNNTGDTTAPRVSRVEITSRPERNATYAAGEAIEVTVTFSETVVVTGTPRLRLNVGGVNRTTAYRSGTGAAAVFVYRVADGESDTDGVSIEANSPALNGGRIRDGADNNALLTHDGLAADAGHKVDGVKPTLAANGGAVVNGATLALTYGEALDGSSTPVALAFTVNVEGAERRVARVAVSGSAVTLTLDPAVGVGQTVRLSYRVPGANPIQDTVGNAAEALTNRAVENNTRDTMAPTVSRVAITSNPGPDGIYADEDVIEVTVTFSETVAVDTTDGTPELALTVGRQSKPALYIPGPASVGQTFTYTVEERDIDTDGVSLAAGRIALNAGTIQDLADNPSLLVYEAVPPQPGHAVDGVRPELQGASVSGATLTLTYGEALDGDSTPAVGDFTVTVMDTERPLNEVLVSGSTVTLTLDAPVTPGETVTVSYTAGTDPIQDTAGNAAEELTEYTVGAPPPVTSTGGGGGGGGGGSPARPTVNTDPVITTPGPFEVEENQTRVVRIEALDSDPGDGIRSYAIAGGADGGRFSIVAHTGVLSFREPPNFEAPTDALSTDPPSGAGDNEYIVVVRVASGPLSRDRTVEQAFAVRVTDENRESPGVPDAPRLTLALDASLTVEWSAPENTGPPITDYDVQYREGTSGFFINAPHDGPARTATLTGLEAATLYQVQVRARNEEGTGRWSEPSEGVTLAGPPAVLPFSVPDRGGISLTSQGTLPELHVGYGQVETDAGMTPPAGLAIFGSRLNGILASEAGVPASVPILEGRIFAETDGPVRTGLALANPNDTAATIAFFFTDSDGIDSGHGTFTLGPREQIARFLDEGPFNGGSAIEGTFTFTADLPVAVIALRGFVNERSEFLMTTLPVASLAVPTTATVYFPHFAAGGGWTTQVILVNPTHAPISGSVQFISSGSETEAAAPATMTLADGRSGSTFSYSIPPRSAMRLRTSNPAGPLQVGSVRAVPDPGQPAPSGVSIFAFQKDGTTVSEAGVPASTAGAAFRLYVEASGTPGQPHSVRSGIALTNTSGAPAKVLLELTDLDGTATGPTESLTIPASGHVARFIDEFFPSLTTPFSGILRIASTGPDIAAVGLRLAINQRDDILVTTTPPVDETAAPTASDLFFPHFVDSGGWTTQFILFSGSPGQPAAGVIRFTGQDGQPLELPVAPTTAPTIP